MSSDPRLRAVLDRLGVAGAAVLLAGGTNAATYRVGGLVVRLLPARGSIHGGDKGGDPADLADHARRAAATGASPPVVAYLPDLAALVLEHVDGRTLTDTDLRAPAALGRTAAAVRRLHTGERTGRTLDMHGFLDAYARAPDLPPGWSESLPTVRRLVDALAGAPLVLCHGDLVAANVVDDGHRGWLVDLDDAVDADPAYDLGSLWVQAGLDESHLDTLVAAYGTGLDPDRVRRWALVVAYTWTAWSRLRAQEPTPTEYDPLAFGDRLWGHARPFLPGPGTAHPRPLA